MLKPSDAEQQALTTLTPQARSISELLASQARVSVASIVAATGASRNTVTLSRLLQAGLLVLVGVSCRFNRIGPRRQRRARS